MDSRAYIACAACFIIGAFVGMVIMSCLAMAGRCDREMGIGEGNKQLDARDES